MTQVNNTKVNNTKVNNTKVSVVSVVSSDAAPEADAQAGEELVTTSWSRLVSFHRPRTPAPNDAVLSVMAHGAGTRLADRPVGRPSRTRAQRVIPGELVFLRQGAREGFVAVADRAGQLSVNFAVGTVDRDVLPEYLRVLIQADSTLRELARRASGTAQSFLSESSFAATPVRYHPDQDVQRALVVAVETLDRARDDAAAEAQAASRARDSILAEVLAAAPRARLGDLLVTRTGAVRIEADQDYRQVTLAGRGRGLSERAVRKGADMATKRQFVLAAGDLVVSRIDARRGALAVVPPSFAGAVVSSTFVRYALHGALVHGDFLDVVVRQPALARACDRISAGTTNRRFLDLERFVELPVPLPSLDEQQAIVHLARRLGERSTAAEAEVAALARLRARVLSDAFSGAWVPRPPALPPSRNTIPEHHP